MSNFYVYLLLYIALILTIGIIGISEPLLGKSFILGSGFSVTIIWWVAYAADVDKEGKKNGRRK